MRYIEAVFYATLLAKINWPPGNKLIEKNKENALLLHV